MTTLKTRARIFVLVILAAFPALLLTVYSAVERRASTGNQARAELRRLVKLAAMQQWQVVEGARQDDGCLFADSLHVAGRQKALHRVFCELVGAKP